MLEAQKKQKLNSAMPNPDIISGTENIFQFKLLI